MMSDVWRIFVIVGDESLNQSLVNALRKDGYAVQAVTNGMDAVRVLWSEEYDVVICDLKTPGADGFELLQWLRACRPNTRLIMVGEANTAAQRMRALEGGAAGYLEKPVDYRVLREELRRFLQQTGFSASLDSFDLLDVIQIINMSRKSITLLINTGLEERGVLRFQNGELIWAEYGVLRGEEAFFALAAHKNGTVTQQPWNEQVASNVTQPLSRLIFQALQYRTKYANRQQYSGEIESVRVTQSNATEVDDTPFMVLSEDQTHMQALHGGEVDNGGGNEMGGMEMAEDEKPWWESTGRMASVNVNNAPEQQQDFLDASAAPTLAIDSKALDALMKDFVAQTPGTQAPQTPMHPSVENSELPSWLTGQPTSARVPVPRESGNDVAGMPVIPATPDVRSDIGSHEWQVGHEQMPVIEQPLDNPLARQANTPFQEADLLSPSPNWSIEEPFSSAMRPMQSSQSGAQPRIAPNSATGSAFYPGMLQESGELALSNTGQIQRGARKNYAALVSALQSLGYAISGFIAAAVVTVDGQPIAQVAVDDIDVSKMCKQFATIQKSVLSALDQESLGEYEDTVITSSGRHLLMRVIGAEKKIFLVVMTTRSAKPGECLEMMVNVGSAVSAALR